MKLIFADFDGVLNSMQFQRRWVAEHPEHGGRLIDQLDPLAVARLNEIIDATGALVVVSSTWRILHRRTELCDILNRFGFIGKVLGVTPRLGTNDILTEFADNVEAVEFVTNHGVPRGCEIQTWLNTNGKRHNIQSFCILDDDSDMVHLKDKLIHTSWDTGLLDCHRDAAITMLGRK